MLGMATEDTMSIWDDDVDDDDGDADEDMW